MLDYRGAGKQGAGGAIVPQNCPTCIQLGIFYVSVNCDQILKNISKSHMKSSVFLHVFNDISTYVYIFTEYFLHSFSNLSVEFLVVL